MRREKWRAGMRESALGRASEGADEPVLAEHLGDSWSHLPVLDTQGLPPLATAELEQLLFSPSSSTQLSRLKPAADSWTAKFPDLTSLPRPSGETRPLSICVATEDIVGPVRNGGIGSTYAALAAALAKAGHHVTILYLR